MSEQERPSGRPPKPQDFSLPSLGTQVDSDGRSTPSSGRRKTASRPFDPTQYVQGRPTGVQPEDSRATRRAPKEDVEPEDLPPPSYQPQFAPQPESPVEPEAYDRVYARSDTMDQAAKAAHPFVPPSPAPPDPVPESETKTGRSMAGVLNLVGAATSIALVLGLGFWGYRLAVRDVSGIPIVKALEGPMRVQPEDPGGELATFQGLAVNAVQAAGEAEATADRLVLAPQPVEVREGDGVLTAPIASLRNTEKSTVTASQAPEKPTSFVTNPEQEPEDAPVTEVAQNEAEPSAAAKIDTPVVAPEPKVVITAPEALDVVAAAEQVALVRENEASEAIAASIPGVSKSPRPVTRPADFADIVSTQQTAVAQTLAALQGETAEKGGAQTSRADEISPESLAAGTNLAQLGAYPSAEIARAEWDKKSAKFEDYMTGKTRVVQQAESGGRAFFRLRVHGFDTINEARQFCAALQAEGAECISVVVRK